MDISYIIPAYNRRWCLEKAIESCRLTLLKYEIIVIDDGSTDGTADFLSTQHNIITVIQANQGKDWAVNFGFGLSKGKYVRFIDSDDWVLPYSSDKLYEQAEKLKLDVVAAGYQLYSETEEFLYENSWKVCDDFLAQQLGECDSSHYSAYLFRKDFIKDIPHRQEFGARDDRQFIIEVALKYPKIGFINSPTLAHRSHSKDRLQSFDNFESCYHNFAMLKIYKRAFATLIKENRLTMRYKRAGIKIIWPLAHWIAKSHLNEAEVIVKWIYELDPDFIIPDKGVLKLLYRHLGFRRTQILLRIRRIFLYQ